MTKFTVESDGNQLEAVLIPLVEKVTIKVFNYSTDSYSEIDISLDEALHFGSFFQGLSQILV